MGKDIFGQLNYGFNQPIFTKLFTQTPFKRGLKQGLCAENKHAFIFEMRKGVDKEKQFWVGFNECFIRRKAFIFFEKLCAYVAIKRGIANDFIKLVNL